MHKIYNRLLLIIIIFNFSSCFYVKPALTVKLPEPQAEEIKTACETETSGTQEAIPEHRVNFIAAGDNLFHITLINAHRQNDGTYKFDSIYTEIKPIIEDADLAFINQETVMAGESFGYSGYPLFNTPRSLAPALIEAGFDVFNIANNHAMDMGRAGLYNTIDYLNGFKEITLIGARKEGESQRIIEVNNITFGFLSYTFSLNGIPLPPGEPNLVSMTNRTRMKEEIENLRPLCDFLIVSMHWGDEYMLIEPVSEQKDLALFLAEHNVDLVIGHHPHVLQRVESLSRPDGKETLCYYSLGNFVSHQMEKERILGGIMAVSFKKKGEELSISDSGLVPVIMHFDRNYANSKVYPYFQYTNELLESHILYREGGGMDFDFFDSVIYRLNTKIYWCNPALIPHF